MLVRDKKGRFIKGNNAGYGFKKNNIPWSKGIARSEETKIKISEARKGKYTGINNSFYGKHHSKKTKELISEKHKGRNLSPDTEFKKGMTPWNKGIPCSQMTKNKISKSNKGIRKGIPFSEQHKINLSKALKGRVPGFLGKHWTEENKRKSSEKHKGENCHLWKGGISFEPYTIEFNKQLKKLIRQRDNYQCQLCGMPECENITKLHIHHIDYNKLNCLPSNLISLCKSCHMKTNFKREYWIQYFRNKT